MVGWFNAHGHYGRHLESDKHAVLCPWFDSHSDNRPAVDSDSVVWEAAGGKWPEFHCSHNHCIDRHLDDVMQFWGDADSFCSMEFHPKTSHLRSGEWPVEPDNLTSAYQTLPSEVRLERTSARGLQQRAFDGDIPDLERLPIFGVFDKSPIIRGWSTMVTAYPKTGKTEALTRWTDEWSRLGHQVGYYTEEPESVWIARLSKLPGGFQNVDIIYAMGETMDAILADIRVSRYNIVVVDTIRLLRITDENDNAAINIALTPFIATCRQKDKTLIMAHHTRKGSGLHGEAAAGGHAFLGIVDVALELHRDEQSTKRRVLKGWGRVFEVADQMYEMQDDGIMKLLGDPKALELELVVERVREAVPSEWT